MSALRVARARNGARRVVVEARAKVNLGLAIGPRRSDGFHELVTVFQSVSLADTLEIAPRSRGFSLVVRHAAAPVRGRPAVTQRRAVPRGAANLVVRAARLLAEHARLPGGARFRLVKRIPTRAGLGGGSADAAATLVGLAALHRARVPRADLVGLAARLGSDVPFMVAGGTALGRGRGERLAPVALAAPFRALIAVPRWTIETRAAYRAIDRLRKHLTPWRSNLRFASQVLELERISADHAMRLGNSFEEALGRHRGDFDSVRARLEDAGAVAVRMTGSGSAVMGLLPRGCAATTAVRRYRGEEALYLVRSTRRGTRIVTRS